MLKNYIYILSKNIVLTVYSRRSKKGTYEVLYKFQFNPAIYKKTAFFRSVEDVFIVSHARTPLGCFQGQLKVIFH